MFLFVATSTCCSDSRSDVSFFRNIRLTSIEGFAAGRACHRTGAKPQMGSRPAIWLLPIEGAVTIRRRAELMQVAAGLGLHARKPSSARRRRQLAWACAATFVLHSLRVAGGVDALGRRKACCRRAVTLVDLLLLHVLCATRKDCSLLCAMHETIVVFTSGLFAGALGISKLLDRAYQAASHMAVHVARARRSHARHSYSTVRTPVPLSDCE